MKKINKLVAYIYMPLIFALVGLAVVYGGFYKQINTARGSINLAMKRDIPVFEKPEKQEVTNSQVVYPNYGGFYADIACEDIKLYTKVYYGGSDRVYQKGVVQTTPTLPGQKGTILMQGNEQDFLWSLEDVKEGNVIEVRTGYGTLFYKVFKVDVGYFNDDNIDISQRDKELLILKTGYPFKEKKNIEPRYDGDTMLVYCQRVASTSKEQ